MGDPLSNPFAQQALFRQLQANQLNAMNNPNGGVPPGPPALGGQIPSIPGGVQDPDQAKMWKAIGDQFRNRPSNGNPAQYCPHPIHPLLLSVLPLPPVLDSPPPPSRPVALIRCPAAICQSPRLLMPRGVSVGRAASPLWASAPPPTPFSATKRMLPAILSSATTVLTPLAPQFFQNIVHMQGQGFRPGNHTMALASGPQANQPNLAQANPTAQQQFLQQQNMQRLGMGLAQQQSQQASGANPGMHPGLANASQAHLNNLQQTNPALLSMMGIGANGMGQNNNHLMSNILRNPNGVLDRSMLDPSMNEQLQAMQRARNNLTQQGGAAAAANQHIRLPSNEHNASPLLAAPHDQNLMMHQGLNRSPQPGNPSHPPGLAQSPQSVAIIHKLDSMPLRELEMRVANWRENLPNTEARVRELLAAIQRPGATPEIQAAFARAKQDYEQHKFLFIKSQEILARKQAQLHQQGQNSARMTPTNIGEPNRPGSRAAGGGLPGQAPGMPGWQGQPGPSTTPQIPPQPSPRNPSAASFQPTPSPQPNADQQVQQTSPQFRPGGGRQTAIPRDRQTFASFIRMWFMQTGRNVENVPKIGDKPLDLYQMYIEVEGLGGPDKVQATGLWHLVAMKMGYVTHDQNDPQLAHIAKVLADAYAGLLAPFDLFCVDRLRALSAGMDQQRKMMNQSMGIGGVPQVPGGVDPAMRTGMLPNENANLSGVPYQRIFAYIHASLKDWMPELPPQAKLMRVSQMDIGQMRQLGWPEDRIQNIMRFKPMLMSWRAQIMRTQALHVQQSAQASGGQLMNPQQQLQPQLQHQPQMGDPRSSNGGGSLPPSMHGANMQGVPVPAKLPFPAEVTQRARLVIESLSREIEQTRAGQYQRREIPEIQRVQMNQAVVGAHPLALEFERTASLHYMLFNDQPQTRQLLDQAALLREQHRILQGGQQQYIMSFDEVAMVQNSLRTAIHTLKAAYTQRVKQHQDQMARGDVGQMTQQQMQQAHHQQQQQLMAQHQHQAAMMQLNASQGLSQPPQLVQQRPPSQPQFDSPKPDPSKVQMGLGQPPKAAPQAQVKQRKPAASGSQPVNTPSPAAAHTPSNMESAPTPSSVNEPATPKSPRSGGKNKLPAKRTPSAAQKAKKGPGPFKLEMPPPISFDPQVSNKRQREDEAPSATDSVVPVAGPSSPKRVKTELESMEPIKYEYHNDNALESMQEAIAGLQEVAPGPNGDGVDPDVLAQLNEFLEGPMSGLGGSTQSQLNDQQADLGPKAEDVFDFSYYLNDPLGDDDPLAVAGVGAPDADTPDLNTNKETPDSAADDIEHIQKSPGKGDAPAGDAKSLAGNRAPTLTEGFWEAFDDGEMPEGAYFMGGGANGFNWSGPIDANATSWIGITGTAA
ncbi:hypothetical protein FRC07_008141 [Ceratobasidium sp. 392]|nr:hypothetical protein FRC07_008141 [Ceratobasidium sp. 392]